MCQRMVLIFLYNISLNLFFECRIYILFFFKSISCWKICSVDIVIFASVLSKKIFQNYFEINWLIDWLIIILWVGSNFSMYGAGRQHFTPPDAHTPGFQGFQGQKFIKLNIKSGNINYRVKSSRKEETSNFKIWSQNTSKFYYF